MLAAGVSAAIDAIESADLVAGQVLRALAGRPDFAIVFSCEPHADELAGQMARLGEAFGAPPMIGVAASGVIGRDVELESGTGLAVLAGRLPGVRIAPIDGRGAIRDEQSPHALAKALHADEDQRGLIVMIDPYSVPVESLLERIEHARQAAGVSIKDSPLIGGLASAGHAPGENRLFAGESLQKDGLIGLSFSGPVLFEAIAAQNCRPVGPAMMVTRAKRTMIQQLDGEPATTRLDDAIAALGPKDRRLARSQMLLGLFDDGASVAVGRGGAVIRPIAAFRRETGDIAVHADVGPGRMIRLHVRDAASASADLGMLLDGQRLGGAPLGALAFVSGGRGSSLFGASGYDARAITGAFAPPEPGEQSARSGRTIDPQKAILPLAGMFCAGQIGRLGARSRLLGETLCAAVLRAPAPPDGRIDRASDKRAPDAGSVDDA